MSVPDSYLDAVEEAIVIKKLFDLEIITNEEKIHMLNAIREKIGLPTGAEEVDERQ